MYFLLLSFKSSNFSTNVINGDIYIMERLVKNTIGLREARSSLSRVTDLMQNYSTGLITGCKKFNRDQVRRFMNGESAKSPKEVFAFDQLQDILREDFIYPYSREELIRVVKLSNAQRNSEIKKLLQDGGFSWIDVKGTYIEKGKLFRKQKHRKVSDKNDDPRNYEVLGDEAYEDSMFIISPKHVSDSTFYDFMVMLGEKYLQDSVVISILGKDPVLVGTRQDPEIWLPHGQENTLSKEVGEGKITYNSPQMTIYSSLAGTFKLNNDNVFKNPKGSKKPLAPSNKIFTVGDGLPIALTDEDIKKSDEEYDKEREEYLRRKGMIERKIINKRR